MALASMLLQSVLNTLADIRVKPTEAERSSLQKSMDYVPTEVGNHK